MTTAGDDIVTRLVRRSHEARQNAAHAESNRDDWCSTLPPEVSEQWIKDADLDDAAVAEIDRLRTALAAAGPGREDTIEECAKICDAIGNDPAMQLAARMTAISLASHIRALASQPAKPES